MRKIVCCTWVFLLIVQSFSWFLYAQEMLNVVMYDDIPTIDTPILSWDIEQEIWEVVEVIEEESIPIPAIDQDPIVNVFYDTTEISDDWDIQPEESVPSLFITEVYFAGTDEWFELYNSWDTDFVWDVEISWVKSTLLHISNVSIPAKSARIFGDNVLMVTSNGIIAKNSLWLSMTDTSALDILLYYSWNIVDTFVAAVDTVSDAKTNKASLQKTMDNPSIVSQSLASQSYNNDPGFIINPWIVYNTLEDTAPVECESRWSSIQIKEIFRWADETMPPYIEIFSDQSIAQNVIISGSILTESLDIFVNQPAWHYHIITTSETGYTLHPYRTDNQKLSYSSGLWNIVIYGQSGQVLDKVDIVAREPGYASYIRGQWCTRVADVVDQHSPWFSRDYLSYFPQWAEKVITITQQVVINNNQLSCWSQTDTWTIDAIATWDFVIEIVSVDYDPPWSDINAEKITLRSLVDYPIDLWSYAFRLNTRNGLQYLRWVLEPEEELTLTDNFRFPNAGACIDLLYGDFIVDTYCYPQEWSSSWEVENDYSDVSISIDSLVYDPPWDDTNNEHIVFTVHSWIVNFSDGFYVLINGRKYNLTMFADQYTGTFTLTANYRMPNTKDACVSLMQWDFIFDTKCYTIPISINIPSTKEQPPNTERFNYDISIVDIDYNPEWLDTNNEKITLHMNAWWEVDLSKFHILINGNKKKLKDILLSWQTLTLIWTYGFPNTKQSCVTLMYQDHVYDTYCYNPIELSEQDKDTAIVSEYTWVDIQIISVFPNPIGSDTDKETVKLLLKNPNEVDLSKWFTLQVNGSRKKVSWTLISWEEYILSWSFTLPNTATCISLFYYDISLDAFCYPQAKEWIVYTKNQEALLNLADADIWLLNRAVLNKFNNKICLTISEVVIKCRNIPASKLARKQYEELKLSRNYIAMMHDYLYQNRQSLYFNTDIFTYKTLFESAKKDISSNTYTRSYWSENIPTSDIQKRFQLQYNQPLVQQLQTQLSAKIFGDKLKQNYQKAKERYYKNLQ